jgi:hypothetical protein
VDKLTDNLRYRIYVFVTSQASQQPMQEGDNPSTDEG